MFVFLLKISNNSPNLLTILPNPYYSGWHYHSFLRYSFEKYSALFKCIAQKWEFHLLQYLNTNCIETQLVSTFLASIHTNTLLLLLLSKIYWQIQASSSNKTWNLTDKQLITETHSRKMYSRCMKLKRNRLESRKNLEMVYLISDL